MSVLLVVGFLAAACQRVPAQDTGRPNILIVVTDDERVDSHTATPNLYRWFAEGTVFERAYATTPHCCPSRASIFTGQYVHNHRVGHAAQVDLLDHDETIQHALREAGYRTGFVGKFLNGWSSRTKPPNFDRWTLGDGYEKEAFVADGTRRTIDYSTGYVFDRGRAYVEEWEDRDDDPWLLMLSPFAPHAPYTAERKYEELEFPWEGTPATEETDRRDKPRFVRKQHYSEPSGVATREQQFRTLRSVDDEFMATIEQLRGLQELENTLVIYLSDNGFLWAEHGMLGKGVPYESAVRVPMYVRGPGVPKGLADRLVANIDVAPTVYEAAGVDVDHEIDGRSLLEEDRERTSLLLEYTGGKLVPEWSSVITKADQYTEYADGVREFYDLVEDPFQLENAPGKATQEHVDALHAAMSCAGDACP